MNPRGFWSTYILFVNMTFLLVSVLWSLVFSIISEIDILQAFLELGIWIGLLSGLIVSFIPAFLLRVISITINVEEHHQFIRDMNVALAEIGYHPTSQFSDLLVYKPSFQAGLLAGNISVQIYKEHAIIIGPFIYVRKISQ